MTTRSIPNALVRVNTQANPVRLRQQLGAPLATIAAQTPRVTLADVSAVDSALAARAAQAASTQIATQIASMRARLDAQDELLRRFVGVGGTVHGPDRNRGISGYVVPSTPGKGGILPADVVETTDNAAAGTIYQFGVPAWARARLTGTYIEAISAVGSGGMTIAEAAKCEVSLFVNGISVVEANRIPLDQIYPTLDGSQRIPTQIYVGADVDVTGEVRVLVDLGADAEGEVMIRFWCGDGTSYDLRMR